MTRKADYPKTVERKDEYTAGDIAIVYGVAHRTACKLIDEGTIAGHRVPGGRERRVLHADLMRHARGNFGNFKYVLDKIEGLTDEERTLDPLQP